MAIIAVSFSDDHTQHAHYRSRCFTSSCDAEFCILNFVLCASMETFSVKCCVFLVILFVMFELLIIGLRVRVN